ncbi:unnamed protein product, partial [Heterosigma akashiwo]
AGGGGGGRDLHERQRAEGLLRAGNSGRQGLGGAALAAHEGDHDEEQRPRHLRPLRHDLLQTGVREARRALPRAGRPAQERPPGRVRQDRPPAQGRERCAISSSPPPGEARRSGGGPGGLLRGPALAGHGQLRQGHHEPAHPQRRDRGRVHARGRPRLGEDVEQGRTPGGHEVPHPGPLLRHHVPRGHLLLQGQQPVRRGHDGQ